MLQQNQFFRSRILAVFTALQGLLSFTVSAEEARIAVAANFTAAAKELGRAFAEHTDHKLQFSFGSTGQLFTQISHGAPYDIFLAADQDRPIRAESEGLATAGSRFTYAVGQLALYTREDTDSLGFATLKDPGIKRIAIANAVTAPYGMAAVETLRKLGLYEDLKPKLVHGTNVAQAYQFAYTGNADLAIVSLSQVRTQGQAMAGAKGSYWPVPKELHPSLAQDAVLLTRGKNNKAARAFLHFLKGKKALEILHNYGYETINQKGN